MSLLRFRPLAGFLLSVAASWVMSCSSTTVIEPDDPGADAGSSTFEGSVDPSGSTVVLQRIDQPVPDQAPVAIELVGRVVEIGPGPDDIAIEVSVRNASDRALFPPGLVWIGRFDPLPVRPTNADVVADSLMPPFPTAMYGFDYSGLLGDDGVLGPGETTQPKRWRFFDPGQEPFSFSALAEFALSPLRGHISGTVFLDLNTNGRLDPDERGIAIGAVGLDGPNSMHAEASPDSGGRYAFRVDRPGLYRLTLHGLALPGPVAVPSFVLTTPNPLQLVLPPLPDGSPQSYETANFGLIEAPPFPPPPVVITHLQPGDIEPQHPYDLLGIELRDGILGLEVGFSGCQPEHPFVLHVSGDFRESEPVQTWALLSHDDLGEPCAAYFTRSLAFDLDPLRRTYIEVYGHPGQVRVHFLDSSGDDHEFMFGP